MSEANQLLVFCYDVGRDSVRNRIADKLEEHGVRVQYSVFECRMTVSAGRKLLSRLDLLKDPDDGIRMYVIPEDGRRQSAVAGGAPIAEKSDFILL